MMKQKKNKSIKVWAIVLIVFAGIAGIYELITYPYEAIISTFFLVCSVTFGILILALPKEKRQFASIPMFALALFNCLLLIMNMIAILNEHDLLLLSIRFLWDASRMLIPLFIGSSLLRKTKRAFLIPIWIFGGLFVSFGLFLYFANVLTSWYQLFALWIIYLNYLLPPLEYAVLCALGIACALEKRRKQKMIISDKTAPTEVVHAE
ncbi:MAG: hypothetical protein ACC608_06655 [Anaerofustis sp.]